MRRSVYWAVTVILGLVTCVVISGCGGEKPTKTARVTIFDKINHKGETEAQRRGLRGRVHTVQTERTVLRERLASKGRWTYATESYTPSGRQEETAAYLKDSLCLYRVVTSYAADGKASGVERSRRGKLQSREMFKRDSRGRISESTNYGPKGELRFRSVPTYDKSGNHIGGTTYGADGTAQITGAEKYDDNGNLIESSMKFPDSLEIGRMTYDSGGNLMEVCSSVNGKLQSRTAYVFSKDGHRIKTTRYHGDGSFWDAGSARYDNNWNRVESIDYTASGTIKKREVTTYDNARNHLSETLYGPGNVLLSKDRYEYEHDAHGNWVKRTQYNSKTGSRPLEVQRRKISYYE